MRIQTTESSRNHMGLINISSLYHCARKDDENENQESEMKPTQEKEKSKSITA
jgi:hypothetical protein